MTSTNNIINENKDNNDTNARACITIDDLESITNDVLLSDKNKLACNVFPRNGILDTALSRNIVLTQNHVYSHQIINEGKPVTNQKSTGTCWIYAALNVMRIPFMKHYKLDKFEFSQSYLFFWDKFEKANFFLEQIIDTGTIYYIYCVNFVQ